MFGANAFGANAFAQQFQGGMGMQQPPLGGGAGGFLAASPTQAEPETAAAGGRGGAANVAGGASKGVDSQFSQTPVTIYQIHRMIAEMRAQGVTTPGTNGGGNLMLHGKEVKWLSFVGQIVSIDDTSGADQQYMDLVVDDTTAKIKCRKYEAEDAFLYTQQAQQPPPLEVGSYVRVSGSVRFTPQPDGSQKCYIGVLDLARPDDETFLFDGYAAVLQQLACYRQKQEKLAAAGHGAAGGGAGPAMGAGANMVNQHQGGAAGGGAAQMGGFGNLGQQPLNAMNLMQQQQVQAQQLQQQQMQQQMQPGAPGGALKDQVLAIFKQLLATNPSGSTKEDVCAQLGGSVAPADVNTVVEQLLDDGDINEGEHTDRYIANAN